MHDRYFYYFIEIIIINCRIMTYYIITLIKSILIYIIIIYFSTLKNISSQLYENKYNYIYSFVFVDQLSVIFFRRSYQTNQYTSMILGVVSNQL